MKLNSRLQFYKFVITDVLQLQKNLHRLPCLTRDCGTVIGGDLQAFLNEGGGVVGKAALEPQKSQNATDSNVLL